MSERGHEPGLPLEQFITALTSQLDRAQNAMALKARLGYPLTFAVKELSLDLRTHIEVVGSVVQIRPVEPGEGESSVIHLSLTTITRPMMEENTLRLSAAGPGEPTLHEALGDDFTDEEKRRLEWAGVQTVGQLVELEKHADPDVVSKIANVPAMRLRAALERAARPMVSEVTPMIPEPRRSPDETPSRGPASGRGGDAAAARLRIVGRNLLRAGQPRVSLDGRPLRVLQASAQELLVEAPRDGLSGTLSVETQPGMAWSMELAGGLAVTAAPTGPAPRAAGPAGTGSPAPGSGEAGEAAPGPAAPPTGAPDADHADGSRPTPRYGPGAGDVWALAPEGYHDVLPAAAGGAP
ncbi:MAG TPA: hypothetical protein VFJ16_26855 [Longimicrobium sp.]|nr:hypothetical protein [Longimicrobium sp.]